MGYQFVHLETYSRKGRDGRDIAFILDEAARRPDASLHVSNPCPPEVVYGCSIDEVRRRHDARAADAITTLKNGKTRAIRKDQNTLLDGRRVASGDDDRCRNDSFRGQCGPGVGTPDRCMAARPVRRSALERRPARR